MKTLTLLKQILTSLGKNILLQAISLGCIFLSFGVAYAAWTTLSPSQWASGQPVTQVLIQGIINNLNDLDARMTSFSPIPAGNIGAFNLATCPAGWIAANGSNGTPDLRGEFIRGLDNGRGVDTGRVLLSAQKATNIRSLLDGWNNCLLADWSYCPAVWAWNIDSFWGSSPEWTRMPSFLNDSWYIAGGLQVQQWNGDNSSFTTRPRNVAFLYCIKQ